jgi:hypothetical protein
MMHFSTSSFIAGAMLGALLTAAWFFGDNPELLPRISPARLATTTESATLESGAVSVANQPFGESATVESVTVPPPGVWVAVREVNGGDLGNVLGAERVAGPRSAVTITLLRATEPGRSYAIQLYRDDNNGSFDPAINSVYVDFDTGARVVSYFTTTQ